VLHINPINGFKLLFWHSTAFECRVTTCVWKNLRIIRSYKLSFCKIKLRNYKDKNSYFYCDLNIGVIVHQIINLVNDTGVII